MSARARFRGSQPASLAKACGDDLLMNLSSYITALDTRYRSGLAREHSYRGDLQNLLQSVLPNVLVTNEPARIACGAPDYILTQKATNIDVGYIEAKDIGKSLDDNSYSEQFERYRKSL